MSGAELIKQAAKLYEARDAMRLLYGPRFASEVAKYRPCIEAIMGAQADPNALTAGIELARRLEKVGGGAAMLLCALGTAVEMIEPSR